MVSCTNLSTIQKKKWLSLVVLIHAFMNFCQQITRVSKIVIVSNREQRSPNVPILLASNIYHWYIPSADSVHFGYKFLKYFQELKKWHSLSVCPSVHRKVVLSSQFSSFWALIIMMTSESIKQAFRENSEHLEGTQSNHRERDQSEFIIPSEPKILRLVNIYFAGKIANSSVC